MDEDVKTLLAVLALVYGSSNGLGLLKTALAPVEKKTSDLKAAMEDLNAAPTFVAGRAKALFRSLWSPVVLVYVVIVVVVPLFLALVIKWGPVQALAWLGLGKATSVAVPSGPATFYWVLLSLSLVASVHYLTAYIKGWGGLINYLRKK